MTSHNRFVSSNVIYRLNLNFLLRVAHLEMIADQSILIALTGRLAHHSDPVVASPSLRSREGSARGQAFSQSPPASRQRYGQGTRQNNLSPMMQGREFQTPQSRSPAQSRAASPLRLLHGWNLHRTHTRDEPFIPVDPFSSHIRWFGFRRERSPSRPAAEPTVFQIQTERIRTFSGFCITTPNTDNEEDQDEEHRKRQRWRAFINDTTFLLSDTLPRQCYHWFLLHLPSLYWQRVARVFEDAEVSKPEIQRLIDACGYFAHDPSVDAVIASGFATPTAGQKTLALGLPYPEEWNPPTVSPALARFKLSWESFVDTLMREWKTFNLVSALLCTSVTRRRRPEINMTDPYAQDYSDDIPDPRCCRRSPDKVVRLILVGLRAHELVVWLRVHRSLRIHAQYGQSVSVG